MTHLLFDHVIFYISALKEFEDLIAVTQFVLKKDLGTSLDILLKMTTMTIVITAMVTLVKMTTAVMVMAMILLTCHQQ